MKLWHDFAPHQLLIFDKPENFFKYALLQREASLIPNYKLFIYDIDSTAAFQLKIIHHCGAGQAAVADRYGCHVVRLTPPTCFFELRERLLSLGYTSFAKDIHWNTKENAGEKP